MALSVGIMQLTLSVAIMQVKTSIASMQVLRFYCNYAGNNFCCSYVDVIALILLTVSAANMCVTIFIVIMQVGALLQITVGIFCRALCT